MLSWQTLWNIHRYQLQANAALVYVNRRHSPSRMQYGIFDLEKKLRLAKAMTRLSNHYEDNLWVTEQTGRRSTPSLIFRTRLTQYEPLTKTLKQTI